MEPEIIPEPSAMDVAMPPAPEASKFTTKSKIKLLPILGGVAVILFSIGLAITFFGNKTPSSTPAPSAKENTVEALVASGWAKYSNSELFYELSLPPSWLALKRSPLNQDTYIWNAEGTASLEITGFKNLGTLDEYLSLIDTNNAATIKVKSATQVKVGQYDGIERIESWPAMGLQVTTTYVKVSDMFYTFTLIPIGDKNAVANDTIIRDYHAGLASFRLTDTSKLGIDLKEYVSKKVASLAFKSFSLKYPQTWVLTDKSTDNSLDVSIYRNNYELTISQKAVGGAVCLFSDSPAFEGSSGDLRSKQFAEFNTTSGAVLRRYFNVNSGDKSSMFFCEKQSNGPYFQTPLTIGGLVYNVPAKYDADIIKEMDEIVKSIVPVEASPSPASL